MINENKLIEDIVSNDGIKFDMDFKIKPENEFVESLKRYTELFRAGIINLINKQQKVWEWIPVTERLPEEKEKEGINGVYKPYLVTLDDGTECIGAYMHHEKGWITRKFYGEKEFTTDNTVVAWMEFPEGYKPTEIV